MVIPHQGDIWWAEAEDQRRPVLVVTRSEAVPVLGWILVAPITRTIRGIPTEIPLARRTGVARTAERVDSETTGPGVNRTGDGLPPDR